VAPVGVWPSSGAFGHAPGRTAFQLLLEAARARLTAQIRQPWRHRRLAAEKQGVRIFPLNLRLQDAVLARDAPV